MGGGLMQLVAYGAQDIYLTGNPQITFFKVVYRRHTNFSMETISQTLDGNGRIGTSENEASCTISRNGDLIYKMYVAILSANSDKIIRGSSIVKKAELEIGGQKIDEQTEEWNDVWNELTLSTHKAFALKELQRDHDKSEDDAAAMVQVPLNFWFCRNPGLALPLIALQYHEVKINFVFGTLNDIATGITTEKSVKFYVDYIYLDTDERRRFAQVSHEYLIEQIQMQSMSSDVSQELTFNHPIKELIWTTEHNNDYGAAILRLNGLDRFEKQEKEYFQLRQPFDYHTSIPRINLPLHAQLKHHGAPGPATILFPDPDIILPINEHRDDIDFDAPDNDLQQFSIFNMDRNAGMAALSSLQTRQFGPRPSTGGIPVGVHLNNGDGSRTIDVNNGIYFGIENNPYGINNLDAYSLRNPTNNISNTIDPETGLPGVIRSGYIDSATSFLDMRIQGPIAWSLGGGLSNGYVQNSKVDGPEDGSGVCLHTTPINLVRPSDVFSTTNGKLLNPHNFTMVSLNESGGAAEDVTDGDNLVEYPIGQAVQYIFPKVFGTVFEAGESYTITIVTGSEKYIPPSSNNSNNKKPLVKKLHNEIDKYNSTWLSRIQSDDDHGRLSVNSRSDRLYNWYPPCLIESNRNTIASHIDDGGSGQANRLAAFSSQNQIDFLRHSNVFVNNFTRDGKGKSNQKTQTFVYKVKVKCIQVETGLNNAATGLGNGFNGSSPAEPNYDKMIAVKFDKRIENIGASTIKMFEIQLGIPFLNVFSNPDHDANPGPGLESGDHGDFGLEQYFNPGPGESIPNDTEFFTSFGYEIQRDDSEKRTILNSVMQITQGNLNDSKPHIHHTFLDIVQIRKEGHSELVDFIGNVKDTNTSTASKLDRNINVYSFALKPEDHQPSGTCNFSRIDTAILEFDVAPTAGNIYAVNYNVLRIMSGMGGLAYSN